MNNRIHNGWGVSTSYCHFTRQMSSIAYGSSCWISLVVSAPSWYKTEGEIRNKNNEVNRLFLNSVKTFSIRIKSIYKRLNISKPNSFVAKKRLSWMSVHMFRNWSFMVYYAKIPEQRSGTILHSIPKCFLLVDKK